MARPYCWCLLAQSCLETAHLLCCCLAFVLVCLPQVSAEANALRAKWALLVDSGAVGVGAEAEVFALGNPATGGGHGKKSGNGKKPRSAKGGGDGSTADLRSATTGASSAGWVEAAFAGVANPSALEHRLVQVARHAHATRPFRCVSIAPKGIGALKGMSVGAGS